MAGQIVARLIRTCVVSSSFFLLGFTPALVGAQSTSMVPVAEVHSSQVGFLIAQQTAAKPTPKAVEGKELVAVMDVEAVGASKVEALAVTERLREELLRTGKYTIVDRTQMDAVLNEQALQQSGCTSQECAVKVGKVLGVRKLITGKVLKISDTEWLLSATVVDVETAETVKAESLRHEGKYFSLLDQGIVTLAGRLSVSAGSKPDLAASVAAAPPQPAAPKSPAASEQKPGEAPASASSSSKWWWIAGGVVVLAAAAAGGKGGGGGSSSGGASGPTGGLHYNW